ncbi:MAG: hypothetical protein ACLUAR_02155 [Pilosibacter sp.]
MEEHSVNLLRECDSGCKMAAESLEQIRDMVSDQELWKDITESYEKHQELDAKIKKTLSAMEEEGKEPGKMASAWSWMSTEMRMMAKGGDKEAASIVTDGCNMGIKTICGYKNQYSGASKAVMEIADELTGMEEKSPGLYEEISITVQQISSAFLSSGQVPAAAETRIFH